VKLSSLTEYLENNYCQAKRLDGTIGDCCCDYSSVDKATKVFFLPLFHKLSQSTFFRHFKVNLDKECPFWEDDGICMIKDCAVCECEPSEIPKPWIVEDHDPHPFTPNPFQMTGNLFMESAEETVTSCEEQHALQEQCKHRYEGLGKLDRTRDTLAEVTMQELTDGFDNRQGGIYVDLTKNPEGYTGYSGPSAAKVWGSIHKENCFAWDEQEQCLEKRIFYRLISGLQGSITTQIAIRYKFEDDTWGYNTKLYLKGVGLYEDRLDNMYFTYIFLLRAIARASPALLARNYDTGNSKEDEEVKEMVKTLLQGDQFSDIDGKEEASDCSTEVNMCRNGFNESALFNMGSGRDDLLDSLTNAEAVVSLRQEIATKFRNISAIMDCVGCEKCKLWGKLQTLGLGTALKVLSTEDQEEVPSLTRNEIVALINTATQFAKSVRHVEIFRELELDQKFDRIFLLASFGTVGSLLLFFVVRNVVRKINKPKVE